MRLPWPPRQPIASERVEAIARALRGVEAGPLACPMLDEAAKTRTAKAAVCHTTEQSDPKTGVSGRHTAAIDSARSATPRHILSCD